MAAAESGNVVSPVQIADGRPRDVNVGVLGGGQLGRMLAIAAVRLRLMGSDSRLLSVMLW